MRRSTRAQVFGGAELRSSVSTLGLDLVDHDPQIVIVDLRDGAARTAAGSAPRGVPRVVVADDDERQYVAALGIDDACVAASALPHVLGPLVAAAAPPRPRAATRVVVATAVRGGTGRTLLIANLARRLAPRSSVCAVDLTGTGALAWWLGVNARPWSDLEALQDELAPDHVAVLASEAAPGLRVVGGPPSAPGAGTGAAAVRAALMLDDLVLVDAPLAGDALVHTVRAVADRVLLLAYDDPVSHAALDAVGTDDWLIASQSHAERLGGREVFRALPRDEGAVADALNARERVRGSLGRAYDELADLIAIDAS